MVIKKWVNRRTPLIEMIQLIDCLPFTDLEALKSDWTRFQEGKVILSEIPDAVCGEFDCEAEIQKIAAEAESGDSESEDDKDTANDDTSDSVSLPSGAGKLILTSRYQISNNQPNSFYFCSKLYWIAESVESSPLGWSIDYKNVLLHAISKPSESRPYIYLQLECNKLIDVEGKEICPVDDDREDDEEDKFVEVNLYVEDEKQVDEMFVALSECASLHPCDDDSDESDFGDFCDDEPERKVNKIDTERFEDAAEK